MEEVDRLERVVDDQQQALAMAAGVGLAAQPALIVQVVKQLRFGGQQLPDRRRQVFNITTGEVFRRHAEQFAEGLVQCFDPSLRIDRH